MNYARALFEVAPKEVLKNKEALLGVLDVLNHSKDLSMVLLTPVSSYTEKQSVLAAVLDKIQSSPLIKNFLSILTKNNRLASLDKIVSALDRVRLEAENGLYGKITSAESLDDKSIDQVTKAFEKQLGRKVEFEVFEDPSLLAGLKVEVNGVTYDGSLKVQLEKIRNKLIQDQSAVM